MTPRPYMLSTQAPSANTPTSLDHSSTSLEIAIIDDHPPIREAIRIEAEGTMDMEVAAETGSVGEASRLIAEHEPDVAIVDLSLEDGPGFELLETVHAQHPDTQLVVFSLHDETVYAERALRAGASGYLMKKGSTSEVLSAVRCVAEGKVYLSSEMKKRVLSKMRNESGEEMHFPIDELTNRELEVFQMMGQGLPLEGIADRLGITSKTVDTHRRRAKEKLGYEKIDELVAHAAQWMLGTKAEWNRS